MGQNESNKEFKFNGKVIGTQEKPSQEMRRLMESVHKDEYDKVFENMFELDLFPLKHIEDMVSKLDEKEFSLLIRVMSRMKRKS